MIAELRPLRFSHHALAVLGAVMLGSTIFSLMWTAMLAAAADARLPGMLWLVTLSVLFWLSAFLVAFPGAGFVLSLLWPLTRRRTVAAKWICVIACATMGVILAPLANARLQGTTWLQLLVFALIGTAVAALYLLILDRLSRDARPKIAPPNPAA